MKTFRKIIRWVLRLALFAFLAGLLAVGLFIAALALERAQPLALPDPGGPYAVGRMEQDWSDPSRADPLADQPVPQRTLPVWIWYPAQAAAGQAAPYLPPVWQQARNRDQGAGILIESELSRIQTHSFENAPLSGAQASYPVLVMEPGMGPAIPDYSALAEGLASQGYIVVGINPVYTSNLVAFADGRVVTRSMKGTIPDSATAQEADGIGNRILAVWAADVSFAVGRLEALDADPSGPFYRRLDLARLGVFGHSFGGATAIYFCQRDPRCKAGANLDGTPFSAEIDTPIPVPFLLMNSDETGGCDPFCERMRRMAKQIRSGAGYNLSVTGARHFNFSDLPLRQVPAARPLFRLAGYAGSIAPLRGLEITKAALLGFFDQSLRGQPSTFLRDPTAQYPEVHPVP